MTALLIVPDRVDRPDWPLAVAYPHGISLSTHRLLHTRTQPTKDRHSCLSYSLRGCEWHVSPSRARHGLLNFYVFVSRNMRFPRAPRPECPLPLRLREVVGTGLAGCG